MPRPRGVALVTGGARRMGRAIALALARDGWDIAVHYGTSKRDAMRSVAAVEATGRRAVAIEADLTDPPATRTLIARVRASLGLPTCIVNNASRFEADDAASFDGAVLGKHMQANVAAPIVLAQSLHRALGSRRRGVVVNLLDQKLYNLNPDFLSYTLSKAALACATTLLAQAFAPTLRVVGIAPGLTLPSADQTRAEFARAHRMTPLGRSSEVEDVADAVRFAASARAITGSVILVDGGQHLVPTERDVLFLTRR